MITIPIPPPPPPSPPSSLLGALRVSNRDVFNLIQTAIPAADFYAVGNEFSLFHIGSKGKGQIHDEIKVLDNLICELIFKSSE